MSKSGNLSQLSSIFGSGEVPTVYFAEDPPYLPRILVFYWPVQAVGSISSTSRIRTTILSAAGFKSYGAFSVAPSSSYYSAVHKLPEDKQRDEVSRAIAFTLCRYFSEIPPEVKNAIEDENLQHGIGLRWGQTHAAQITCKMNKVFNTDEILEALKPFQKEPPPSPVSVSRPLVSIRKTRPSFLPQDLSQNNSGLTRFTTPSKRFPSGSRQPSASTSKKLLQHSQKQNFEQIEALRFKMCEFVDTEDRYIARLQDLIDMVIDQGRTAKSINTKFGSSKSEKTINAMLHFPSLLDQIKDFNLAFLDDIESILQKTEEDTLNYLDQSPSHKSDSTSQPKDPAGIHAFAKALLNHFPKFPVPYRSYLDLHSQVSSNLDQFFKDGATSIQIAPSLLMEPAQRISRYGLYIDTMIPFVPTNLTLAIRTLEKARKIIAEICEMEPAASTILDSLRIEHESKKRSLSPTKLISGLTRSNTVREAPAKAIAAPTETPTHATFTSRSMRDRETPRLLPGLTRSFSKKSRSRPALANILSEQNPEHINNIQGSRNDENNRPTSSGSGGYLANGFASLGRKFRPGTSDSNNSGKSFTGSANSPSRPGSRGNTLTTTVNPNTELDEHGNSLEYFKAQVMRLEQENYKLLAENAELKRQVRECKCGKVAR